jgi:hypothetical protein
LLRLPLLEDVDYLRQLRAREAMRTAAEIDRVGVVGCGLMWSGSAEVCARWQA